MNREEINERARDGKFAIMAQTGLSTDQLNALCKQFEGVDYVLTDDFLATFAAAIRQLRSMPVPPATQATTGIRAEVAQALLCALLLVPDDTPEVTQDPNFEKMTVDEIKAYREDHHAASRAAERLKQAAQNKKQKLTLEKFDEILRDGKAAVSDRVKQILLNAREEDAEIRLPSGERLPSITPPPKTLASGRPHKIRIKVLCVHSDANLAEVQVQCDVDHSMNANADLVGRKFNMSFSTVRPTTRKWLVGAQWIDKSLTVTTGLVRALRGGDFRHNLLTLSKVHVDSSLARDVRSEAEQLELDLGAAGNDTADLSGSPAENS